MKIIYVDDERPALDNFRLTVASLLEVKSLHVFQKGEEALAWVTDNPVDAAFLDMEMPGLHGLKLAAKLKEVRPSIRIVFVTAFSNYAMNAWELDAVGYILKPYDLADIRKEINKISSYRPMEDKRVAIQTIPLFSVSIDGTPLYLARSKVRELFALLVDRGKRGITTGEGISVLWPDRENDAAAQSLFRMTYKRLVDALTNADVGDIIGSQDNRRFLYVDKVNCDLYRILEGDRQEAKKYDGQYMDEYSWAEDRNGQLYRMLLDK